MIRKDMQKIEETLLCPECGSKSLNTDEYRAELICNDCGLVIEDGLIDYGPEWRAFNNDQREKRARTGTPMTPLLHDKGLSTIISWQNRDYHGKSIPTRNRSQVYRLRKWQKRARISNNIERNLMLALSELERMASILGLPRNVRETTAIIYRNATLKKLVRGRSIEGVSAAALYAACRQYHIPRTLDEIAASSRVSRKEIGRTYRFIARELGLKLIPTSPEDYVSRFCSELKLSNDVKVKTMEILKHATNKELISGRGPVGIAAASLYIASVFCGERRTQNYVAEVAGVTEVTIRNRYKELLDKLNISVAI